MNLLKRIQEGFFWLDSSIPRWLNLLVGISLLSLLLADILPVWPLQVLGAFITVSHVFMRIRCAHSFGLVTGSFERKSVEQLKYGYCLSCVFEANGRNYTAYSQEQFLGKGVGKKIGIFYQPEDPEQNYIYSLAFEICCGWLLLISGVLSLLV